MSERELVEHDYRENERQIQRLVHLLNGNYESGSRRFDAWKDGMAGKDEMQRFYEWLSWIKKRRGASDVRVRGEIATMKAAFKAFDEGRYEDAVTTLLANRPRYSIKYSTMVHTLRLCLQERTELQAQMATLNAKEKRAEKEGEMTTTV